MTVQRIYRARLYGNLLTIRAAIGDAQDRVIVARLLVDTGASYTMLPVEIVEAMSCDTHHPVARRRIVSATGVIVAPVVHVPWFHCLGERVEDFPVVAHTLPPGVWVDGLLGIDFLSRCRAVIDVAQAEIRCDQAN